MKRIKSILMLIMLVILSFSLFGCTTSETVNGYKVSNAYVTLDINPSVEIITGEDGLVAQVNALNDDAQVLLVDTNFVGKTVDEVVAEIVKIATDLGYIDFEAQNAIVVTAEAETPEDTEELEETITERVQKFVAERQIKLDIIKAKFEASDDMKALAESLNISVGKLKLITFAMEFDETLTLEDAAKMPVRDLNRIIMNSRGEVKDLNEELRNMYLDLKDQLKVEFFTTKVQLTNEAINAAADEKFAALLEGSETTVEQVKTLYAAYLQEVLGIVLPTDEEVETQNQAIQDQIDALMLQQQEIMSQLNSLIPQFFTVERGSAEYEALMAQGVALREQLFTLKDQIRDLSHQISNNYGEDNGYYHHERFGFGYNFDKKCIEFDGRFNPMSLYAEVKAKYQALFAEINVDLDDLEALFADDIASQLEVLEEQAKTEMEALQAEIQPSIDLLHEYVKEENAVLRDTCRNRRGK